jgi:hypothetical protein
MSHIRTCSVVYFPGHGGNFFKLCLSLSPETVPYYTQDITTLTDFQCLELRKLTSCQRQEIIKYNSIDDYIKHHSKYYVEPSFYYQNKLINNYYNWAIVSNHPNDIDQRIKFLDKILYIELDLKKYSTWISSSRKYFRSNSIFFPLGTLQPNELNLAQIKDKQTVLSQSATEIISMTDMLDSQQGFLDQYQKACKILNITPVDNAVQYYLSWRHVRVDPFL